MKFGIADDIRRIHKKIRTYVYAGLAVAPQVLPLLSEDVKSHLPTWLLQGISVAALVGVSKQIVKVQVKKDKPQDKPNA